MALLCWPSPSALRRSLCSRAAIPPKGIIAGHQHHYPLLHSLQQNRHGHAQGGPATFLSPGDISHLTEPGLEAESPIPHHSHSRNLLQQHWPGTVSPVTHRAPQGGHTHQENLPDPIPSSSPLLSPVLQPGCCSPTVFKGHRGGKAVLRAGWGEAVPQHLAHGSCPVPATPKGCARRNFRRIPTSSASPPGAAFRVLPSSRLLLTRLGREGVSGRPQLIPPPGPLPLLFPILRKPARLPEH